jgi:hypothetical protein
MREASLMRRASLGQRPRRTRASDQIIFADRVLLFINQTWKNRVASSKRV